MAGNLANRVKEKVNKSAGSTFWKKFIVTSSDITVAQKALSGAASGDLMVLKVIFQTDSTGLAGPTNFELGVSGETYGPDKPVVEAVSNLGASVIRIAPSPSPAADTTNDNGMTVTAAVPFLLEDGDSLQYSGSVAAGTGAGKVTISILFQKVTDGADIKSVL